MIAIEPNALPMRLKWRQPAVTFRDWTFDPTERIVHPSAAAITPISPDPEATMNLASLQGKSQDELLAIIASMNQQTERKLSLKVTDKGGVSLYGLGRFPVTLYASQWDKLIGAVDQIKAFVDTNRALLSTKD